MRFALVILTLLSFAMPSHAQQQPPAGMNNKMMEQMQKMQTMSPEEQQAYMQKLMEGAAKMQACYEAAGGEAGMKELEDKGRRIQAELDALCAAGKRDKAQAHAKAEAAKMMDDPRAAELQKCARDIGNQMPFMDQLADPEAYLASNHVCDIEGDE